jgi:hypothetical protein
VEHCRLGVSECRTDPHERGSAANRSASCSVQRQCAPTPTLLLATDLMCWFFSHHDVLSCCNALVLADRWCMNDDSRTGQWGVPSSGHTLASIADIRTALASNGQPDDHRLLLPLLYIALTRCLLALGRKFVPMVGVPGLAQVTTDWVRVASAARRIPIRAIVPVKSVSPPDPSWPPDYPSSEVCGRVAFTLAWCAPSGVLSSLHALRILFCATVDVARLWHHCTRANSGAFSPKCPEARVAKSVSSSRVQFKRACMNISQLRHDWRLARDV